MNIIETKDKKLIYKLAKKFDADLHAIEKIIRAWIAKDGQIPKGIIGVCKWDTNYGIIDLFVPKGNLKNYRVMDKLVSHLVAVAQTEKVRRIYCHMGDLSIDHFLNKGFIEIKDKDLPTSYFCACAVCPEMNKTCFPKPIMWQNKNE